MLDVANSSLTFKVETITPAAAKKMRDAAHGTSKLSTKVVVQYAKDMETGSWFLNGEAIVFSGGGKLIDGRKRIDACVRANTSFQTLVIRGVDVEAFETIDMQRKRTVADILTIEGNQSSQSLYSTIRLLLAMASGAFRRVPFSDHAVFTLLDRYPGIRDSLSWSMSLKGRQSTVQLYAALHFLLSRIDPKVTVDLLERSCDITRQKKSGDAAKSLRDVLMTLGGTGFRVEQEALCACVVKAWNAVRTPGRPGVIKWKEGENFPEISGWTDAVALDVSEAIGRAAAKTGDDKVRFKKLVKVDGRNMVARLVHITPELARRLLELNGTNRKIAARHVDKYARDMAALRWLVNGETIKFSGDANIFDKDGQFVPSLADVTRLIDGQHRLNACVQSGRSFNAIVVTGLRETAFEGLDRGAKKSFGHYLGERGYGHAAAMAGAARLIFDFESSRLKNRVDPSNAELDDVVERHAGLEKPPELLKRGPSMVFPSTFWAAYVLFGENNAERAKNGLIPPGSDPLEDFFTKFATGAGLEVGSPVLALRNRLTESVRLGNTSGEKTHNYQQLKYLVAAWNDYVCGRNKKSYNMSVALQEDCQSIVLPTVKFKRVAPKA